MATVTYEEIKDLPNHPEKLLVDVRNPDELQATGQIPTSINIPCKFYCFPIKIKLHFYLFVIKCIDVKSDAYKCSYNYIQ